MVHRLGICSSEAYCVGAAGSSEECGITLTDVEDSPLPNPVSHYLPLYLWECNIRTNKGFNSALNQVDEFYSTHPHSNTLCILADVNIYSCYH
jgi:hypothetical protein